MSTAEIERLMGCFKLLDSPLTQARTPSTVSKLISIYKDAADVDSFDFPMATLIWKHLEAMRSGRQVTQANPLSKYVYFANPPVLPTPGKKCVNSFEEILPARKLRQARKAKIRDKIAKNIDRLDVPVDDLIEALEDEEEIEEDEAEQGVQEQQVPLVVLENNDAVDNLVDIM